MYVGVDPDLGTCLAEPLYRQAGGCAQALASRLHPSSDRSNDQEAGHEHKHHERIA